MHETTCIAGLNGIDRTFPDYEAHPVLSYALPTVSECFEANTVANIALYQAVWPLLQQSSQSNFIAISTGAARIEYMDTSPFPSLGYAISMLGLNYMIRRLHFDGLGSGLVSFAISPGLVRIVRPNTGREVAMGIESLESPRVESVESVLAKIDRATRDMTGGTFQSYDDAVMRW